MKHFIIFSLMTYALIFTACSGGSSSRKVTENEFALVENAPHYLRGEHHYHKIKPKKLLDEYEEFFREIPQSEVSQTSECDMLSLSEINELVSSKNRIEWLRNKGFSFFGFMPVPERKIDRLSDLEEKDQLNFGRCRREFIKYEGGGGRAAALSRMLGSNITQRMKNYRTKVMINTTKNSPIVLEFTEEEGNTKQWDFYSELIQEKGEEVQLAAAKGFSPTRQLYLYDGCVWEFNKGFDHKKRTDSAGNYYWESQIQIHPSNQTKTIIERASQAYTPKGLSFVFPLN